MEEYWNYIKWLGKLLYKSQLEEMGNIDVNCIFHDEINYKVLNEDIVFIIDCSSIEDSIRKIYKYKEKIEKNFKVLDISVFKGNDNVYFSETYLVTFYSVDKQKYTEKQQKYDCAFKENTQKMDKLYNLVCKVLENEKDFIVEVNNIPQNDKNESINEIYCSILENTVKLGQSNIEYLNNNRSSIENIDINGKRESPVINNKILENTYVDYVEKVLKLKVSKKINGYKKIIQSSLYQAIKKSDANLYNRYSNAIVILDCKNDKIEKKCLKVLKKLKCSIILIKNDNVSYGDNITKVKTVQQAQRLLRGYKGLYVSDTEKIINDNNIISIKVNEHESLNEKKIKEKVLALPNGIYAFSNLDHVNSVKVITSTFFSFDGDNYYSGGAERYLIDLHYVCQKLGMKLRIYQKANFNFFRYYNNIEVVGISCDNQKYNYEHEQNMEILNSYNEISQDKTKLNIYSSFLECYGKALSPSVGISHGVAWDYKENEYHNGNLNDKEWIIESALSCDKVVSVDTNTANYFQTVDFKLGNTTNVVPNYVDIEEFKPDEKIGEKDKIILLYPRRLYAPRGLYLVLDITDKLMSKYENIEIHFVGKGFKEDTDNIQEKIDRWGNNRIKMYNCPPDRMYEVYKNADISVIPTLYSEGTSLSCLEAMATGNAVIATRIGGLPDLIINNYNGKLIEPNANSLFDAICDFISDKELMNKCKKNAREVAKTFNKKIWIEKWEKIILDNAKKISKTKNIEYKTVMIYVSDENLQSDELKKLILEQLMSQSLVFVVNENVNKSDSYGRIQYIKDDSDLYRKADVVFVDDNYKNTKHVSGKYINLSK